MCKKQVVVLTNCSVRLFLFHTSSRQFGNAPPLPSRPLHRISWIRHRFFHWIRERTLHYREYLTQTENLWPKTARIWSCSLGFRQHLVDHDGGTFGSKSSPCECGLQGPPQSDSPLIAVVGLDVISRGYIPKKKLFRTCVIDGLTRKARGPVKSTNLCRL